MMRDWISFWDSDHPIYVNARHFDVHYREIANDIIRLIPSPDAKLLDHGCGEALHADLVAAKCGGLFLCEAAPTVRTRVAERFKANQKIRALTPEDVEKLPDARLDLIAANSLAQYLKRDQLAALLQTWKRLLKPKGSLVIADVIGHEQSAAADALSLLRFAARNGFLIAAFLGLVRTVFSDYRKLRARLGLTTYSDSEMISLLQAAGFNAMRMPRNFGHNQSRMAFLAEKA